MAACVEAPELHARIAAPWTVDTHGVRMDAGRDLVLNDWHRASFGAGALLTGAACCATFDYATRVDPGMKARVGLRADRGGIAHGLALWFDATLAEGVEFSGAPGAPGRATIYGHVFLPWPRAVALAEGDEVEVAIDARLVGGQYVWSWESRCGPERFRQSTFRAEPASAARLRLRSATHVARLGEDAQVDGAILEAMRGGATLGEIASSLQERFPARFARWEDALARVGDLAERYARPADAR